MSSLATWGPAAAALARAARGDTREPMILGWALATARQRDPDWAEALLGVTLQVPELIAIVRPERREDIAIAALGRGFDDLVWHLLLRLPAPWSERLAAAVLRAARARPVQTEVARRVAPELVPKLLSHPALGATLPILERRAAMHRAFQEPA